MTRTDAGITNDAQAVAVAYAKERQLYQLLKESRKYDDLNIFRKYIEELLDKANEEPAE